MFKHDSVVRAWLDGKTIQIRNDRDEWVDIVSLKDAHKMPCFHTNSEYRFKPAPIRVARLYDSPNHFKYLVTTDTEHASRIESSELFNYWATDWIDG